MNARTLERLHSNPPAPFNLEYREGFSKAVSMHHAAWCDAHPDVSRKERAEAYRTISDSLKKDFPTERERRKP